MGVIVPGDWSRMADISDSDGSAPPTAQTIGEVSRAGRGLAATCEVCLHSAQLDLADLSEKFGAESPCSEVVLREVLQCTVCKSTEAVLQMTGPSKKASKVPGSNVVVLVAV